jgi:uncharacterized SAM-dependent methyltransferase
MPGYQNDHASRLAQVDPAFRHDVLKGLSAEPHAIPARWLYDRRGSALFEAITALPHFEIDGWPFSIAKGQTIHTENSLKYGPRDASVLLRAGGWMPVAEWTDQREFFSLILAKQEVVPSAP